MEFYFWWGVKGKGKTWGRCSRIKEASGRDLPASSQHQLKTTSRKKSLEYSVQKSFHEEVALFYLELGSLERPGETGFSRSRGVQSNSTHSAFSLPASCTNSMQQRLNLTTENAQSPASLVETSLLQVSTKKRKRSGGVWVFFLFFPNFPFPFFFLFKLPLLILCL